MSEPVECALCHKPVRSAAARAQRIGSGCWRKLSPAKRRAIRRNPSRVRAVLSEADGQLPLEAPEDQPS